MLIWREIFCDFNLIYIIYGRNFCQTIMGLFTVWDYVVFVTMLLISASIGVYYRFTGGKQKTTNVRLICEIRILWLCN